MKHFATLLFIALAMVPFSTASNLEGTTSVRSESVNLAEMEIDQGERQLGKVCEK